MKSSETTSLDVVEAAAKKVCTKCGVLKPLDEYLREKTVRDGRRSRCKVCTRKYSAMYREKNREMKIAGTRRWRKENPEKARASVRNWKKENPEKVREMDMKKYRKEYGTVKGKLSIIVSNAIWKALRENKKGYSWERLCGFTADQLKQHIEKNFLPGMTWENYGKYGWHIDHKTPVAAFNFERPEDIDFRRCWSLKNLQPLWAKDNIAKRDMVDRPFQPSLMI